MEKKNIVSRLLQVAEIIKTDSDYVYDPSHTNRPHSGGQWYRTEKGWSTYKNDYENRLNDKSESDDWTDRAKAAMNRRTRPEILKELAKDRMENVRRKVAYNPNTPPETLKELYKESQMHPILSRNPSTPAEILSDLAKHKDPGTRRGVAKNPSTPTDVVRELTNDPVKDVKVSAIWEMKRREKNN